jgi:hypothetical protein
MSGIAKYALENPNALKNLCADVRKAVKTAAARTVNDTAFQARKNLKAYVLENFNNPAGLVTGESLFVTKVPYGHVQNLVDIYASVGFSERVDFMRRQDQGGWKTPKEPAKKLSIFTDAAKEGLPTIHIGKRGKQTIRGKAIHTILNKPGRSRSHKANRVARAFIAHKTGLLMYLGPNNSLFKVTDFHATDGEVQFKTKMFINRAFEKTFTPARIFFLPACEKAMAGIQDRFNANMDNALS